MAETFAVPVRGVGKPDYTRDVSSSIQRAGIYLKYTQALTTIALLATDLVPHVPLPYPIPWVKAPIAVGGTSKLYDVSTGAAGPFTNPKGYTMTIVQMAFNADQDFEVALYFEVTPGGPLFLVQLPSPMREGGGGVDRNLVVPYSSATFDPTGATSHLFDAIVINRGGDVLKGGFTMNGLLEAVGTPPLPGTKDCQCPFCNHIQTVMVGTTVIVCDKCGKTYYVQDFSTIRKL